MAGTTSKGLRYPTAGDAPNVSTDIQNLATDVDTEFDNYVLAATPTFTQNITVPTGVIFEGATSDGNETTLTVVDPTQDNTITLPNTTGTVMLRDATETMSNKTLGSNLAAGGYKVTGLGAPSADTDSATVAYAQDFARTTGLLLGGM